MVRAAATRAFDFSVIDPFDNWWWRRLTWTLDELERQANMQAVDLQLRESLTRMVASSLDPEAYQRSGQDARDHMLQQLELLWPWVEKRSDKTVADEGRGLWELLYGDMDSPENQLMIQASLEHMQKLQAAAVKDDE